jgi:hypothetical protein
MGGVPAMIKKVPPREPLTSLDALIRDFQWRCTRDKRDDVVTVVLAQPSLYKAIDAACASVKSNGKMYSHQVKVRAGSREALADILKTSEYRRLRRIGDFHALWELIDSLRPWGIGPLTVYDVAVRIGAYLGLEPVMLYLHADARTGLLALADALGLPNVIVRGYAAADVVESLMLPHELKKLTMDETEDFLCGYRAIFWDALTKPEGYVYHA